MLAVASQPAELPEEVVRNQCVLGVISVPGRKRIGQCLRCDVRLSRLYVIISPWFLLVVFDYTIVIL